MSEAQSASALERMYEDTTVRDEIVDQDAMILLKWGEAQVMKLAQKETEDSVFEDAYYKLTKVMGRINRFVGKRQDADETEQTELLNKFVATATEAGYAVSPETVAKFAKEHASLDNAAAIRALIAMIDATSPEAPPTPPPTQPESPFNTVINWIKSSTQGKE